MVTHYIFKSHQCSQGTIGLQTAISGDSELNADYTWIASGGVDPIGTGAPTSIQLSVAFVRAKVKCLVMTSTVDMVVKQNTSGGTAINLTANTPIILSSAAEATAQFAADITALYLTSVATAGTFQIRILLDLTP